MSEGSPLGRPSRGVDHHQRSVPGAFHKRCRCCQNAATVAIAPFDAGDFGCLQAEANKASGGAGCCVARPARSCSIYHAPCRNLCSLAAAAIVSARGCEGVRAGLPCRRAATYAHSLLRGNARLRSGGSLSYVGASRCWWSSRRTRPGSCRLSTRSSSSINSHGLFVGPSTTTLPSCLRFPSSICFIIHPCVPDRGACCGSRDSRGSFV